MLAIPQQRRRLPSHTGFMRDHYQKIHNLIAQFARCSIAPQLTFCQRGKTGLVAAALHHTQPSARLNPHRCARGTLRAPPTAISCLGAFRPPAATARGEPRHRGGRKPAQIRKHSPYLVRDAIKSGHRDREVRIAREPLVHQRRRAGLKRSGARSTSANACGCACSQGRRASLPSGSAPRCLRPPARPTLC